MISIINIKQTISFSYCYSYYDWHKNTKEIINFMEFLKFSNMDTEGPDDITIKSKSDLKEKLQEGLNDIM